MLATGYTLGIEAKFWGFFAAKFRQDFELFEVKNYPKNNNCA